MVETYFSDLIKLWVLRKRAKENDEDEEEEEKGNSDNDEKDDGNQKPPCFLLVDAITDIVLMRRNQL